MAHRYPQQTFAVYAHPQWPEEVKGPYPDDDDSNLAGDRPYDHSTHHPMAQPSVSRRHSLVKVEEEFGAPQMWHDRSHPHMVQMRHYSTPAVPSINTHPEQMVRLHSQSYAPTFGPSPTWPMPGHSESSTPTPMFGAVQDPIPVQFNSTTGTFPFQHEPSSAIAMSPQSSQGGWGSTTSTDSGEQRHGPGSPQFRAMSPNNVLRPDSIRKKNARIEIPKEISLLNIDERISHAADEKEKKELKQQKRLLRNRQAALDSRQRKKMHTDRLEADKKVWLAEEKDLKEKMAHFENVVAQEREQMMQQRQQYEAFIQNLQYERDEAIRTKTIETAELRRQNNVLKDCVRDLERQQAARGFTHNQPSTDTFANDFSNFGNLDLGDDSWDDEFSLIDSDDLKMEGGETPQRQLTPRPLPTPQYATAAPTISNKADAGFSWNTFYMCLLFGAFIASQPATTTIKDSTTSSSSTSRADPPSASNVASLPTLSDDYRLEASNVLKAVLSADSDTTTDLQPDPNTAYSMLSGQHNQQHSSLDTLSTTLTTPSRQQQAAAAFSLTPTQYEHITNPDGMLDMPSPINPVDNIDKEAKSTPLQAIFATMQAERDTVDRLTGLGGKTRERSVLLERVPEKVLRDFRALVAETQARKQTDV
ncbi:uncharacterized protein HMPREF1541_08876 [Cyphellophora europaea CBS 101466]|uniref:BZIP domain-containing protein n=1 Tax=Cyphellophora europaea (strain CBS 101466) TaxID=1220924 RepID=W2RLL0_CYPE1|nr:uncharacterized protein HMPREF1541_08876 [Cyphellophora europaea CBS 101466]ETN36598.1 hypothetical protein HMPREF1541_08876 [Cyphellophora europaea CBS 101466]